MRSFWLGFLQKTKGQSFAQKRQKTFKAFDPYLQQKPSQLSSDSDSLTKCYASTPFLHKLKDGVKELLTCLAKKQAKTKKERLYPQGVME